MANSLYGNVWYVDTAGIISKSPIWIRGIMFYPNTQADAILFNWWDEANVLYEGSFNASSDTGTITETNTSTHTLTSARFPATNVVQFLANSSCVADNKTYHLIGTAGNDHRIIVDPTSTMTDESTKDYHVKVYPSRVAIHMIQPADTNQYSMWMPFPGPKGFEFHNLVLESISSTCSAQLYLAHD
jgi:hypothetical protein